MEKETAIQKAIKILTETNEKLVDLLQKDHPGLVLRTNEVFNTLSNGYGHIEQRKILMSTDPLEQEPLTEVMGIDVTRPVQEPIKKELNIDSFREEVQKIYEGFEDRTNKDILESLKDLEIRGVAKLAGLDVTEDHPEKISSQYVTLIKARIKDKRETEELKGEAEKAEGAPEFNEDQNLVIEKLVDHLKNGTELSDEDLSAIGITVADFEKAKAEGVYPEGNTEAERVIAHAAKSIVSNTREIRTTLTDPEYNTLLTDVLSNFGEGTDMTIKEISEKYLVSDEIANHVYTEANKTFVKPK